MDHQRLTRLISLIVSICLGIGAACMSYSQVLIIADEFITNLIYQYNPLEQADKRITLVTIDDAALQTYGPYNTWSRELLAQAVCLLNSEGATVIGLDTNLSENRDAQGDAALVEACKSAGNVVVLASAGFDNRPDTALPAANQFFRPDAADSTMKWKDHRITSMQMPYKELAEVASVGLANATQQSSDGSVRQAALSAEFDGGKLDSFAVAIYKAYQDANGKKYNFPELDNQGLFGFNAIFNTNSYQTISLSDLLSGNYDSRLIKDNMILVGEYQDLSKQGVPGYLTIRRESQDILLQAAIIQSLLVKRTVVNVNRLLQALIFGVIISLFYFVFANRKFWMMFVSFGVYQFLFSTLASIVNMLGYRLLLLVPILFSFASTLFMLLQHLLVSTIERKLMERTLKMYVDSSVVEEIVETNPLELSELSRRLDIAVLFVDVRGFTTLSESLEPEQVVKILNAYFTVVADAIQRWGGTLDKFIGDAAMAIFNAPKKLENYCFYAACAADDILKGFGKIKPDFEEKYKVSLNLGIGINAGEAIVGNIGCKSRMDYTAIGDTVNTASRLESKAAPGQILISESMYHAIREYASMSLVGDLQLKGKAQAVKTYEIARLDKPEHAPNERRDSLLAASANLLLDSPAIVAENRERMEQLVTDNKERVGQFMTDSIERVEQFVTENREYVEDKMKKGKTSE